MMKHKVVAGLTTKNEDWIINRTLKTLDVYCDSILIYDDGSDDKTEEICRSYDKVVWEVRPPHDPHQREEAKQRLELLELLGKKDPEYVLFLDADEIPTPNIVDFINNIDTSVDLWRTRMINLWEDESKYRVDNFTTKYGTTVNWDPFGDAAWTKHILMKFDPQKTYQYKLHVSNGGCSQYHPAPENPGEVVKEQDCFYTIHYGKLAESHLDGSEHVIRARWDANGGKGSLEDRLAWHIEHNKRDFLETKKTESSWFWRKDND